MPPVTRNDDQQLDQTIGLLLRYGTILSALVIAFGAVLYLRANGHDPASFRTFVLLPADLRSPVGILVSAFHGRPLAVMQLGILLLIATPVARVVFSVIAFAIRRDRLYVVISGIVLAVLAYSLFVH